MIAAGVLVALALGAGGFLIVVLANGFSTKDSVDPTIEQIACEQAMVEINEQQAEERERLGENAPVADFEFPEICFE